MSWRIRCAGWAFRRFAPAFVSMALGAGLGGAKFAEVVVVAIFLPTSQGHSHTLSSPLQQYPSFRTRQRPRSVTPYLLLLRISPFLLTGNNTPLPTNTSRQLS
ncbi:unnamed protein product, partial [Ectocarpus sp. 13 AM-2016]